MEPTEAVEEHTAVSRSPCLLSNWVEERATAVLDRDPSSMNPIGHGHAERHGHRGILTTQLLDQIADSTTHQDSYRKPISDPTRQTVCEALTCAAEEVGEMESTTKRDFHVDGFVPQTPLPTKSQDYCTDQAITFWTENLRRGIRRPEPGYSLQKEFSFLYPDIPVFGPTCSLQSGELSQHVSVILICTLDIIILIRSFNIIILIHTLDFIIIIIHMSHHRTWHSGHCKWHPRTLICMC
ncbi:hypothetical protein AB205_0046700 [Aquarana catesbeiana]|uniref:Sperm-associated antigen 8 n=1 Tax=Aquarana catesbeiana TaxID=8400 RepID=A0A2G9RUR3_AQUCT|nr:hypothetical protein AB205_0046700 [Aquarana catesbeiana]PIO31641.1 hypothetical protein AB205_0046700 [Aquarana catesbeiana]